MCGWKCFGPVIGKGFARRLKNSSPEATKTSSIAGVAKDLTYSGSNSSVTSVTWSGSSHTFQGSRRSSYRVPSQVAWAFALAFPLPLPFPLPFPLVGGKLCEKMQSFPYLQSPAAQRAQSFCPESFGVVLPVFTNL